MASLPYNIVIPDTDIAKYLNDENGTVVYPVTKQRFVLDSEGNSLEGFVTDINSRVSNLEESQGSGAFFAVYNTTPISEILEAFNSGKEVYCSHGNLRYRMYSAYDGGALFSVSDNTYLYNFYVDSNNNWGDTEGRAESYYNKKQNLRNPDNQGYPSTIAVSEALQTKQDTLVSGTNIKTINNISLLGEGNISIEGGGGGDTSNCVKVDAQTFSAAQKTQARQNIGAGTSNFSGSYNDLADTPTIPSITAMSTSEIDAIIANEDSN